MDVTVSAAEAAARFEDLLQGVRDGRSYTVTDQGRPVAKITAAEGRSEAEPTAKDLPADPWADYLKELRARPAQNIGRWTRNELYERDGQD